VHQSIGIAKRIRDRIVEPRGHQDNELWHLLILQDLIVREGAPELELKFFWLPQVIAFGYYQFSWLLYVVNPKWSYGLNADFEDHAEHEYMQWVADNPQWETEPFDSDFAEEYGVFESIADLFRQIGHDERVRKEEASLLWTATVRTGRYPQSVVVRVGPDAASSECRRRRRQGRGFGLSISG
jgi:ubiquinol oxidase